MRIDMNALQRAAQGDPAARVSVSKAWLLEVASTLEILTTHRPYDTSAIRMLATTGDGPKAIVQRQWLNRLHVTLSQLDQPAPKRTSHDLSSKQEEAWLDFDRAFDYLNSAFTKMFH